MSTPGADDTTGASAGAGTIITVNIKCSNGQKYHVDLDTSKSVLEFKQQLEQITGIPVDKQRLIPVVFSRIRNRSPSTVRRELFHASRSIARALTWLVIVVVIVA